MPISTSRTGRSAAAYEVAEHSGQRSATPDLIGLRRMQQPGPDLRQVPVKDITQRRPGQPRTGTGVRVAAGRRVVPAKLSGPPGEDQRVDAAQHPQCQRAAAGVSEVTVQDSGGGPAGQQVLRRVLQQAPVQRAAEPFAVHCLRPQDPRGPLLWALSVRRHTKIMQHRAGRHEACQERRSLRWAHAPGR